MNNLSKIVLILPSILLVLLLIAILFFTFPLNNMEILDGGKIQILNKNKIVHPGEMLNYQLTYNKTFNLPAAVTKQLVISIDNGEYNIMYKTFMGQIPTGTHTIHASVKIPNTDFVVGKAKLVVNYKYHIFNGLRTVDNTPIESEPFEIKR